MRRRLVALSAFACLVLIAVAVPDASATRQFAGRVVAVHDGDTITVLVGRRMIKVRLEGVDCPELGQPYGRVAKTFTSDRVFGKDVRVEQTAVDRYGRSVGRVMVNGEDLSMAIVSAGLAWHYTQYSSDRALDAAEQSARTAHRGLWSQANPVPPWVYRRPASRSASGVRRPESPSVRPEPVEGRTAKGPFHGNVQSHVFHAPGCRNYNCVNCTAIFATREEAIARGYKPAGDCSR